MNQGRGSEIKKSHGRAFPKNKNSGADPYATGAMEGRRRESPKQGDAYVRYTVKSVFQYREAKAGNKAQSGAEGYTCFLRVVCRGGKGNEGNQTAKFLDKGDPDKNAEEQIPKPVLFRGKEPLDKRSGQKG